MLLNLCNSFGGLRALSGRERGIVDDDDDLGLDDIDDDDGLCPDGLCPDVFDDDDDGTFDLNMSLDFIPLTPDDGTFLIPDDGTDNERTFELETFEPDTFDDGILPAEDLTLRDPVDGGARKPEEECGAIPDDAIGPIPDPGFRVGGDGGLLLDTDAFELLLRFELETLASTDGLVAQLALGYAWAW